jgi:predicted lipase
MTRPLTVVEFDDKHQQNEMVYGVTKDDVHKRITLVFRGTENQLAFSSNWSTNAYIFKEKAIVPEAVKAAAPGGIWLHNGFYNYVFNKTKDTTDQTEFRKYDEVLEDVKSLMADHPGYKLYVTGHSLGAALASLVAFYLACEDDIPKPVTCLNFASPRIGDPGFRDAVRSLEERKMLRMLRVV